MILRLQDIRLKVREKYLYDTTKLLGALGYMEGLVSYRTTLFDSNIDDESLAAWNGFLHFGSHPYAVNTRA